MLRVKVILWLFVLITILIGCMIANTVLHGQSLPDCTEVNLPDPGIRIVQYAGNENTFFVYYQSIPGTRSYMDFGDPDGSMNWFVNLSFNEVEELIRFHTFPKSGVYSGYIAYVYPQCVKKYPLWFTVMKDHK